MKNLVLKIYITVVCLFSNLLIFANPGDESDIGNLEGGDAPAPIGDYLWILAVVVVVYSFWKIKVANNTKIQD